jgi:hypothetical protein
MTKIIIAFSNFANAPRSLTDGIQTNVFFLWLFTILHSPEIYSLQSYYIGCSGNSLSTFRGDLSVPTRLPGIITVRCVITQKSADLIYFTAEAWNHGFCILVYHELLQKLPGIFPGGGGKGGRCVGLTTLQPSCAVCPEIWAPQSPGTFRACPSLYRDWCTY